jgi:glycosyltransferase involved in cell wall biosynthesis
MKILHIIGIGRLPRYPDREAAGGLTHVSLELARLQVARGHQVVVAAVARTRWRTDWHGVQLVAVRGMPRLRMRIGGRKLDLSTLLPLFLVAVRYRFDVIHSHEYNYLRYLPAGIRITHFHNDPYRYPSGNETAAWAANECMAAARYSHAHVAVSRFIAERLRLRYQSIASRLPEDFNPDRRIHVVHNGVDLDRFNLEKCGDGGRRFRQLWGVGENEFVFLYSGAIAPDKGVLTLARAFAKLAKVAPSARLVLAGDAALWEDEQSRSGTNQEHRNYQQALYEELADLIDQRRVIGLGLVPPSTLPDVYAAADVVVVPSLVQEAFCLSAAEALAMSKPLVASRVGGLVEFTGEENSVLVPPGDEAALFRGLRLLVENDHLRARLGTEARRSISSYTWFRAARQLEDLYENLLARKDSIVCAKPPAFYRL